MKAVAPNNLNAKDHAEALWVLTRKRDSTVTLTANATSTTVTHPNVTENSVIMLMPKTANAAAALATTSIVPARGSFVITHANNAQTDRDFAWAALGD